jgi:hypothetical protein
MNWKLCAQVELFFFRFHFVGLLTLLQKQVFSETLCTSRTDIFFILGFHFVGLLTLLQRQMFSETLCTSRTDFFFFRFLFSGAIVLTSKTNVFSCDKVRTAEDMWMEETDGQRSVSGGLVNEVLFQVYSIMFWMRGCSGGYPPFNFLTLWHFLLFVSILYVGHVVAQLVEALRYKPEGRGFDSRWRHWNLSLT